jgi:nucleoid-associated protein YgaU
VTPKEYELQFISSEPATLTLELFFDTYEEDRAGVGIGQSIVHNIKGTPLAIFPGARRSALSVTKYTEEVAKLARIDRELHHPPICRIQWGTFPLFEGVLTSLIQKFTLFQADGTPVRATLTCIFKQYTSYQERIRDLDLRSADVPKTHTVRRGDTLSSIAALEYGDPGLWRHIARANQIINPRNLMPGQILQVPKLKA